MNDKYFASWEGRRRNGVMRAYLSVLRRVYDPERPPLRLQHARAAAAAAAAARAPAAGPG